MHIHCLNSRVFMFGRFQIRPNSAATHWSTVVRSWRSSAVLDSRAAMQPVLTWFCRYRAATAPATSFTSAKVAALDLCLPIRCLQDRPAGKFISRVRQAKLGRTGQLQGPWNHSGLGSWILTNILHMTLDGPGVISQNHPNIFISSFCSCHFHKNP